MKMLVIGSEGFIGNSIAKYFVLQKHEVIGIDNKIKSGSTNYAYFHVLSFNYSLESIINVKPDVCIFAGGSANVQLSMNQPNLDFESNVFSVSKILESLVKINNKCKFIHISSAAVYGNPLTLPIKESSALEPLSPYGWHKYKAELLCKEYFVCYQLPTCSVRPFSVYGNGQKKLLFWDLYNKFNSPGKSIDLYGSGEESRDFIHIDDFLKGLNLIIEKGDFKADSYNLACGEEVTVKNATELFKRIINSSKEIIFNKKVREGDPKFWKADMSRLRELGFVPEVSLTKGLETYYKWLQENV